MTARSSISNSKPPPRSHAQRRARRAALWFAAVIVLSPIAGGMLVDRCPLRFRFPEAAALQESWRKSDAGSSIVLFGSSRMATFMQSECLAADAQRLTGDGALRVFNAAIPAADPITIEFLAGKLLEAGKAPRLAIIEISPDFLARRSPFMSETIKRVMAAGDLPRYLRDIVLSDGKSLSTLASTRLIPFYRYRTILREWAGSKFEAAPPAATPDAAGTPVKAPAAMGGAPPVPTSASAFQMPLSERIRLGAQTYGRALKKYRFGGCNPADMEKTVALLRKQGTEVVLVRMPLTEPFRAMFTPEVEAQFAAYVQRLQTRHGCKYVNLWDRIPDSHFVDVHHGSVEGSREFCEILAREAIAPEWTER